MTPSSIRRVQTAYEESRYDARTQSLHEQIRSATYRYLAEDLGLSASAANERAEKEIAGTIGRSVCRELAEMGIPIAGRRVLDLGAGLGGLSVELARDGAIVLGLEPGTGWCKIAAERLRDLGSGWAVQAVGETMPVASTSMDVIVSMQVMEHVQDPRLVIQEAYRVLRPGGYFYFAYENYFGFWEPHYRVFWLPLLPKEIGSFYLRMRGRNPQFLNESVTYTTFRSIRKILTETGFECMRDKKSAEALASPAMKSLKWRVLKGLGSINKDTALALVTGFDYSKRIMRTAVYECMRKPS